jgi:hypothetical protein
MFDKIKELAAQCNIQELDGYMVNVSDNNDGMMHIRADQFNEFCRLVSDYINKT